MDNKVHCGIAYVTENYRVRMKSKIKKRIYNNLMNRLVFIDGIILKLYSDASLKYSPIFILGPPRSGTTLVYQSIVSKFKVCYLSNLHSFFYSCPVTISILFKNFGICSPKSNFLSHYGETPGWNSPSQGFKFWARWFYDDQRYQGETRLNYDKKIELLKIISFMERVFSSPFVNKWQGLNSILNPVQNIFENSLYVVIKRKPEFNAQSILIGRKKFMGSYEKWYSTKPKNFSSIISSSKGYIEEVCNQLYYIQKDLKKDLKKVPEENIFQIHYEDFCENPENILLNLKTQYERLNKNVQLRENKKLSITFNNSNKIRIKKNEFDLIRYYISELYKSS